MEDYRHGIRVLETPTDTGKPVSGNSGLQVVFGTAPVNLIDKPENSVNKLIYCETYEDAVRQLGYSEEFEKYTLCQSMYASFKLFKVAPVIFVNVLDPKKHKTVIAETSVPVIDKQAVLTDTGVLLSSITVKSETTNLVRDTDYILSFDSSGKLVVTLLSTGSAYSATSIKISGEKLDPSAVTSADIVGGYDAVTGKESGIELIRQVFPRYGRVPGTIIAPGWSDKSVVSAALQGKCSELNGKFSCMCLIDLSTTVAQKYTDVAKVKNDNSILSKFAIALWPMIKSNDKILAYSAVYGALCAYLDINNDEVPSLYPSNKLLDITSSVLVNGSEVVLDEIQGNTLNAQGIVTIINQVGLRAWGNNTAAYPVTKDPKDRWIAIRRCFNWYANSFIIRFIEKVDDPTNYKLIESFIDTENMNGNALVAEGKLAGAKIEFNINENKKEQIIAGKIRFKERIAPYTPAEYIENELSFDPNMIENAIGGNSNG
jgi:hypothetical protein|nr:MAG TPA: tail sheath tube [Caudoviricetes sp.]